MPRFEAGPGVEPPKVPHLGVQIGEVGSFVGIPPGATIAIIEDPKDSERVWLLTLLKVNHNFIDLKCACGRPRCTRTVKLKAIWKGQHIRTNEK